MPDLFNIADLHHLLNMKPGILVLNTNYLKKNQKYWWCLNPGLLCSVASISKNCYGSLSFHMITIRIPPQTQRPCKIRLFVTRWNEKSIVPWQMVPNTSVADKHRNLTFNNLFHLIIFNCCLLPKTTKATATLGKKTQLYLHLILQYSPNKIL